MESKPKIDSVYSFKSKTGRGNPARIVCYIFNDKTVVISKLIFSKEDLTKTGIMLVRSFKWGSLYKERIAFKFESFLKICHAIHTGWQELDNNIHDKTPNNEQHHTTGDKG